MPRVLAGRAPAEAAAMVPRLFSVCAHAQGSAAASALASAQGNGAAAEVLDARSLAVALEAMPEDLRRLMIDVPTVLAIDPCVAPVAAARKAIAPVLARLRSALALDAVAPLVERAEVDALRARLAAILRDDVLGMPAEAFVGLGDANALLRWARQHATTPARVVNHVLAVSPRLGASEVPPMPEPTREALTIAVLGALDEPGFDRAPRWAGSVVETGARARRAQHPALADFVREHGNGVAARLIARLVDVAQTVLGLVPARPEARIDAWSPRAGEGIAAVHTARGLLLHRARVDGGRVAGYAIVAPTEWNFHPEGALVRGLVGREAGDAATLSREANLLVQALDPCVACEVEVGHA
jgi:hypothetical protein